MLEPKTCPHCTTPALCVIACPNNCTLDQMKYPVCEPAPIPEDSPSGDGESFSREDDEAFEIVFEDNAPPE